MIELLLNTQLENKKKLHRKDATKVGCGVMSSDGFEHDNPYQSYNIVVMFLGGKPYTLDDIEYNYDENASEERINKQEELVDRIYSNWYERYLINDGAYKSPEWFYNGEERDY